MSEIAGVKFEQDVNVVAMMDGSDIPLPPGSGVIGKDGKVGGEGVAKQGYGCSTALAL